METVTTGANSRNDGNSANSGNDGNSGNWCKQRKLADRTSGNGRNK